MTNTFLYILIISFSLLTVASALTLFLKGRSPQNTTLPKVWIIVKTWWLIVSFLLLTLGTAPYGMLLGFAFISVVSAFEYYNFSKIKNMGLLPLTAICIFIGAQYWLLGIQEFRIFQMLPTVFILLVLPPVIIFKGELEKLAEIVATIVGPVVFFHFLACLPALFLMSQKIWADTAKAQLLVFLLILLTEGNDISQFICGKLFGRRKVIPKISPNKTEAGFIGGLIITTSLSYILFTQIFGLVAWQAILLGVLISAYGIMGDLFFSAVKRYFGTKDFSDALPGHGGYLDRLDSLILTSPVVFYSFFFITGGI